MYVRGGIVPLTERELEMSARLKEKGDGRQRRLSARGTLKPYRIVACHKHANFPLAYRISELVT